MKKDNAHRGACWKFLFFFGISFCERPRESHFNVTLVVKKMDLIDIYRLGLTFQGPELWNGKTCPEVTSGQPVPGAPSQQGCPQIGDRASFQPRKRSRSLRCGVFLCGCPFLSWFKRKTGRNLLRHPMYSFTRPPCSTPQGERQACSKVWLRMAPSNELRLGLAPDFRLVNLVP